MQIKVNQGITKRGTYKQNSHWQFVWSSYKEINEISKSQKCLLRDVMLLLIICIC